MSQGRAKIPGASRILTDERFAPVAKLLDALNKNWTPHAGQIEIGEHIFVHGARRIFVECGRKFGKTEFAADLCWRLGNMIQNGQGYYFGAYSKAVREFLWAPKRLQNHGPKEYISKIHETDMRLTFTSGTFVKLEGSDEFKVSKGFNPDFVILDEFADYSEDFWQAMSPNFASKDTIVIIISSPPWQLESEPGSPVLFVRIADLWKDYQEKATKAGKKSKYIYYNAPTHKNPHINREWLADEERDLRAMMMDDVWEREYEAKRVVGGGRRIIGTFSKTKHVIPHDELMLRIERDKSHLQWGTIADPGSASVFGGLVLAVNPFSKEIYFLDEIYEKDEDMTTEHIIWPRFAAMEKELFEENEDPDLFTRVYDEAEKWWQVGVSNEFQVVFNPTEKAVHSKSMGLSILRTAFRYDKAFVSDRCKWFAWELENYRKDARGNIPKTNDHLIDCSRYGIHALGYYLLPEDRNMLVKPHPRVAQRLARTSPEQDIVEAIDALHLNDFSNQSTVDEILKEDSWDQLH